MATLTNKARFNALNNAAHIFAFCEEQTQFCILEIVNSSENSCKAIVQLGDGAIVGLFTDSPSAKNALYEAWTVFGDERPMLLVKQRKTGKDKTIYYVEVQD